MEKRIALASLLLVIVLSHNGESKADACHARQELSEQQVWNIFAFSDFEIYLTLAMGIASALLLALSLLSWVYLPSFLMPSDIIFVLLCGIFLDNLTLIIEAIYSQVHPHSTPPSGFGSFCNIIGFLNVLGNVVYLSYNAFFCGALAYTIHSTLRKPLFSIRQQHLICLFATVVAFLIIISTSSNQPFAYMCIYPYPNSSSLSLFFLHLTLTFFSFYSLKSFRSSIPQNTFFQEQSHFKYYFIYMVTFCIFQGANSMLFLIGNLTCSISTPGTDDNSVLQVLYTVSNIMTIVLAFASVTLRLGHPFILKQLKNVKHYSSVSAEEHSQDLEEFSWVSSLVNSIKGSQVLSFIEAIMINYIEHSRRLPSTLSSYHFQRQYSFVIDQAVTDEYIRRRITNRESHFARQLSEGLTTLQYQVQIFTPEYYSWLFKKDNINLFASFDLRKNLHKVKQQAQTLTSKHSEFFFITFDHQFLLKTIQSQQAEFFLSKTQSFYNYFFDHPNTFIVKILGLFKFQRKDIKDQTTNLIIMKNLTMACQLQTLRTYAIKGTMISRSTMKERRIEETEEEKLRTVTLKDKDFRVLEHKLNIQENEARMLKDILTRDINFLNEMGVMDYSLLIIKRQGSPSRQFGEFESTKEANVVYHIGIIDYLQEWSLKQKAARVFKTMITNEQMSGSCPRAYSERLLAFVAQIL